MRVASSSDACTLSRRLSLGSSCKVLFAWLRTLEGRDDLQTKAQHKEELKNITKAQVMALDLPRQARWLTDDDRFADEEPARLSG